MDTILSIILYVVVGFWLLGIIGRFLLKRWLIKKQREMAEGKFSSRGFSSGPFSGFYTFQGGARPNNSAHEQTRKQPEGQVHVTGVDPQQTKRINGDVGEYVDYEDVK